eukprot:347476-Prymnesium_polylepis.1
MVCRRTVQCAPASSTRLVRSRHSTAECAKGDRSLPQSTDRVPLPRSLRSDPQPVITTGGVRDFVTITAKS